MTPEVIMLVCGIVFVISFVAANVSALKTVKRPTKLGSLFAKYLAYSSIIALSGLGLVGGFIWFIIEAARQ